MDPRNGHCAGLRSLLLLLCLAAGGTTRAARPMATDDTSTAGAGECQIEVWGERVDAERSQVLAPACGLTDTLELDSAASRNQGGSHTVDGMALGLKWVPAGDGIETALGTVRFGLEGGVFWARDAATGWKSDNIALLGLGSLSMGSEWNLYANLGTERNLSTGKHVNGLRTALAWQPSEHWLLFVEALAADDGARLRNAGLRLWAVPEVLGLDFVASRSGSGGGTSFSLGLGWYGLKWP